jgi:hypothetical protein
MPVTFQQELAVYTGRFVVIRGEEIQGPFDTPEQAWRAGRLRHGAAAFLVKQVHGETGFASRAG